MVRNWGSGRRGVLRVVATTLVLVNLGTACGAARDKRDTAERIISSVDRATDSKTAELQVTRRVDIKLSKQEQRLMGAVAGGGAAAPPETSVNALADLANDRVEYVVPVTPGAAPEPIVIYSGMTIYQRRFGQNDGSSAKRPWVVLDLQTVDPDDIDNSSLQVNEAQQRIQAMQVVNNPMFFLRLLRGTLTGSVREIGPDPVRDIPATHFKLNVDREKAVEDEDEEVKDAYTAMFKSMAVNPIVLPAEVWLDKDGRPLRFKVKMTPTIRRRELMDLTFAVELYNFGAPIDIALPGPKETVKVEGIGSLAQAARSGS